MNKNKHYLSDRTNKNYPLKSRGELLSDILRTPEMPPLELHSSENVKKNNYEEAVSEYITPSHELSESLSSPEEYQNILASNLNVLSKESKNESDEIKPTLSRLEFVQSILNENNLKPLLDYNECDTETAMSENLNKKIVDSKKLFLSMNVRLEYIKSGTTGHTFKAISTNNENIAFAVKVCAYPKDEYGGMNNLARPENAELRMIKLLSYFVIKIKTPHLVLPIYSFNTSITNFVNIPKSIVNIEDERNDIYKKFIKKYYKGEFENFVSVLISEWYNGGDLLDYIRKNYRNMTTKIWTIIFFQILFTLSVIQQKYPTFRHNDLKANNILVRITNNENDNRTYKYSIAKTMFEIPNINLQIGIWDFDFACIDGIIENNKVNSDWTKKINISKKRNRYYDMHYFFNTISSKRFFPEFYKGGAPIEIIKFIHRVIPSKYRIGGEKSNKKGRIQVDDEFLTPLEVILKDPIFEEYRFPNDLEKNQ
jgi:hypothetical protein